MSAQLPPVTTPIHVPHQPKDASMTAPYNLFEHRREELEALIDQHLQSGALDEGNAGIFETYIDAWLDEAVAGLELARRDHRTEVDGERLRLRHTLQEHERAVARRKAEYDEAVQQVRAARAALAGAVGAGATAPLADGDVGLTADAAPTVVDPDASPVGRHRRSADEPALSSPAGDDSRTAA